MNSRSITVREALLLGIPRISLKAILINREIPPGVADCWIEWNGFDSEKMVIVGNNYRYEQLGWIQNASWFTKKRVENVGHFASNYNTVVKYIFQQY